MKGAEEKSGEAGPPPPGGFLRRLAGGALALGTASFVERGLNFLANLFAARLGGPENFGAYSFLLGTARTVANYAGLGIGTTSLRFAGEYPRDSPSYLDFLRALGRVVLALALLATVILVLGAGPIADYVLENPELAPLLRLAGLACGATVCLACFQNLCVGLRSYKALLLLAVVSGGSLVVLLPLASTRGPREMILVQVAAVLGALLLCLLFARRLGLGPLPPRQEEGEPTPPPHVGRILRFGLVQLLSVIGLSVASWWLTALISRYDPEMREMGLYGVSQQIMNLSAIVPGVLAQVTFPLLAGPSAREHGGPSRVLLINATLSNAFVLLSSGFLLATLPWVLPLVYGSSYVEAEHTALALVAAGALHMAHVSASHRLSIVGLRRFGQICILWSVIVIGVGTWLVPHLGAAGAAFAWLGAHAVSSALVLLALWRIDRPPRALYGVVSLTALVSLVLLGLGWLRAEQIEGVNPYLLSALMGSLSLAAYGVLVWRIRSLSARGATDRPSAPAPDPE